MASLFTLYLLFLVFSALFFFSFPAGCRWVCGFWCGPGRGRKRNLGIVLISVTLMYTPPFSALVLRVGVDVWFLPFFEEWNPNLLRNVGWPRNRHGG